MTSAGSGTAVELTGSEALGAIHKALYRSLAASVAVVTADAGEGPVGMTASSVMAVSLHPPLLLVSLSRTSTTLEAIVASGRFGLNLLTDQQDQLAARFAQSRQGWVRFRGVPLAAEDPPVLAESLAGAVCRVEWSKPGGDHVLVLGEIERHWLGAGMPLVWHRSGYHRIQPQE